MRFTIFLLLFGITGVLCKNHVKSLTEQMGQEIIEMGAPIKELPPGLDEEPSAEFDDEEKTSASVQPATKRETKRTTTTTSTVAVGRMQKAENRTKEAVSQEEEEKRIEKELAEIYKDTDYKSETTTEVPTVTTKPTAKKLALIGRAKTSFKFQPDVEDREDVERFRTSIDDITCDKRVTQRLHDVVVLQPDESVNKNDNGGTGGNSAYKCLTNSIIVNLSFLLVLVCH